MLSIVVPATDSPPTLAQCEEALRASAPEGSEVIVQSTGGATGPAAARNRAAAAATGDVLVFVDADVVVHPDALGRIERAFRRDARLDALFGAYDDAPAAPGPVSRFRNLLHHHVHSTSAGSAETFWAGLGAVRRDVFERHGGFDEARFPEASVEDIELGMRLRASGHAIELDPAIQGKHLKRWTLRSMVATDFHRRGVPWVGLQAEARSAGSALNLSPRRRLSAIAALLAAAGALARRPRLALGATAASVALDAQLYRLLAKRGGPALALAGVPLHLLHQLTAIASVPAGLVRHAIRRDASR